MNFNNRQKMFCGNCGRTNHNYKNCKEPTISVGVLNILITTDDENITKTLLNNLSVNIDDAFDKDNKDNKDNKDIKYNKDNNDQLDMLHQTSYPEYLQYTKRTQQKGVSVNNTASLISISSIGIIYNNVNDIRTFCLYKDNIKFLMIKRKYTLGFLELLRGRYNLDNVNGISFLFKQMIKEEINILLTTSFDDIWKLAWPYNNIKEIYQKDYDDAKDKFSKLKSGFNNNIKLEHNLEHYVKNIKPIWIDSEWGLPKGRRNYLESDITCAIREFQEETDFKDGEYVILDKMAPIKEKLVGTDGKEYKHIYYPALSTTNKIPEMIKTNKSQSDEIGGIGWFTYEEAIKLIRPYHTDRKKIITEMFMFIINSISNIKPRNIPKNTIMVAK